MLSASITPRSILDGQSSIDGGALQMREDEPWTFMPRVEECLNDERFSERQVRNDLEAKNIQGGGPSKSQ